MVAGAADALEPHRIATYLHDTAGKIHLWYHKAHVLNEPEAIMRARLVLARAAQLVVRNGSRPPRHFSAGPHVDRTDIPAGLVSSPPSTTSRHHS